MDMKKRTFAQRIAAKLEAFNERLEARNRKRQQIPNQKTFPVFRPNGTFIRRGW